MEGEQDGTGPAGVQPVPRGQGTGVWATGSWELSQLREAS